MSTMHVSASAPNLTRKPLLQGGSALMGMDYEATLQIIRHHQRLESVKPTLSVQREEQERHFQRHCRFVQIRQRYRGAFQVPQGSDSRGSHSRRHFERRLERMLLKDWDGKERDFAWRHVKSRELRAERAEPSVPAENTSSATRGPTTGGGGREEEVPIAGESPREAESLDSKLAVERSDSSAQGRGDDLKGRSEEGRLDNGAIPTDATSIKDGATLAQEKTPEPHTNEPSSLGGFGGIAADGGLSRERRMRPPDFRSIQQGDNEPAPSQGQQGGLVLKPLDSLNRISGSGNGSIPGLQAMAGESKPIGLVTDTSASPTTDFFKEENGYVPSAAAGGRRPRRPRAGQL
ncbi:unnamed protein product [Durusdinium trenchii]|uniref:Uncharacterized protein n=1 Tax=Durusdinium trenchii TaxID=1381693 RepID=A0ABP0NRC2_9DINO